MKTIPSHHPDHHESDPSQAKEFCPVSLNPTPLEEPSLPKFQAAVTAATNDDEFDDAYIEYAKSNGAHVNMPDCMKDNLRKHGRL